MAIDPLSEVRHEVNRFGDHPPRLAIDADGYAQLHVTPKSKQAELMVQANAVVARTLLDRIEQLERAYPTLPDNTQPTMPSELFTLANRFAEINRMNARLRGREPYGRKPANAPAPSELYSKPSIVRRFLGRLASKSKVPAPTESEPLYSPFMTGAHFQGNEVSTLLENLELAAGDLNQQSTGLRTKATQTLPQEAENFLDQARVKEYEAEDMLALHNSILRPENISFTPSPVAL